MPAKTSEDKHLYRSKSDRIISGVCGGIAEYFKIDSNIVRVLFVIFSFTGAIGIILYVAALIIVPENPVEQEVKGKKVNSSLLFGLILIAAGGILLLREVGMFHFFRFFNMSLSAIWGILLIAVGIVLLFQAKKPTSVDNKTENVSESQNGQRIYRSKSDRMLAGVCGGIGIHFNIDPSMVRVGWVLATFFTFGIGIIIYVLLMFILPEEPSGEAV